MGVDRIGCSPDRLATSAPTHDAELHHPRFHHHAARAMPSTRIGLPAAIDTGERARRPDTAGVVASASLPACPAAGLAHGNLDLAPERQRRKAALPRAARADAAGPDPQFVAVVPCHAGTMRGTASAYHA